MANEIRFFVNAGNAFDIDGKIVIYEVRFNPKNSMGIFLAPPEALKLAPPVRGFTFKERWLECSGPARLLTRDESQDFSTSLLFEKVFELIGLTEIQEGALGEKMHTNKYIREKMWHYKDTFFQWGSLVQEMADNPYDRRKWLSEQVDALWK